MSLLLGINQAAKETGISTKRLRDWCRRRIVTSVKAGGRVLIPRQALESLVSRVAAGEITNIDDLAAAQ